MGNEESSMVDDSTRPSVLKGRNMEAVAKYIKERDVKRIVVMVGLTLSAVHPNMHC
jgi:NAD+-dependent protein deacetylase SIR2